MIVPGPLSIRAATSARDAAEFLAFPEQIYRDDSMEDEPISPREEAAVREAWADVAAGRVISEEEIDREFGLPRAECFANL